YELENMSRVLPAQLKYLTFPDPRYEPVKRVSPFPNRHGTPMDAHLFCKPTGGVVVVLDKNPSEPRETLELRASKEVKQAAAPETLEDRINRVIGPVGPDGRLVSQIMRTEPRDVGGAAAAVGVLTAIDEDEEGAEEAPVPHEFNYESDGGAE